MSTDRDTTRIVRSWLDEGVTQLPDRVLDAVLDRVPATPQRRATWWPAWRSPFMNTARIALATAAVVASAVIGYQLLGGPGVGNSQPTATPSPSVSPSPTPQPWADPIRVGRNEATIRGIRFSFRIPSDSSVGSGGWVRTQYDGMINKFPPGNWIGFLNSFDSVASDPCAGTTTPVGPSVADMADALTTIPGTEAEAPVDATIGGRPAKLVTLTINDDIDCAPSSFWIYGPDSAYPNSVNSTIRVWVFELDGTRYTIHSNQEGSDAEQAQEITEIVESIQVE
ncbi:MAG: hypothetical protein ACRDHD_03170 [Candidatus Limnocylindria bacterium]